MKIWSYTLTNMCRVSVTYALIVDAQIVRLFLLNREAEKNAAQYFVSLSEEERKDAFNRVNNAIKLSAPVDEIDPLPPIHNLEEYFALDLSLPPSLVSDCQVVRGEITATVARAGRGKTTLLTNRMMRWAAGLPLFDDLPDVQAPVAPLRLLLIENEGSGYMMRENMEKLYEHIAIDEEKKALALKNLMVWGDGGYTGLKVDRHEDMEKVRQGLNEHKPDILLLEPFRGIWSGDENDNSAMEEVLDGLVALAADFECGIMLSHHANKAPIEGDWMGASRGATALEGKVAAMEIFYPVHNEEQRELKWAKKRYGAKPFPAPIRMEYDFDTRSLKRIPDSELEQEVLSFLASDDPPMWWSKGQIAEEVDETQDRIDKKALRSLLAQGRIVKKNQEGTTKYRLKVGDSDKGEELDF